MIISVRAGEVKKQAVKRCLKCRNTTIAALPAGNNEPCRQFSPGHRNIRKRVFLPVWRAVWRSFCLFQAFSPKRNERAVRGTGNRILLNPICLSLYWQFISANYTLNRQFFYVKSRSPFSYGNRHDLKNILYRMTRTRTIPSIALRASSVASSIEASVSITV